MVMGEIILGVISVVGLLLGALIERNTRITLSTREAAQHGAEAAQMTVEQTENTGNGFAGKVLNGLREIRQDIGGIRAEMRDTNRRVDHLSRRLDAHLDPKDRP